MNRSARQFVLLLVGVLLLPGCDKGPARPPTSSPVTFNKHIAPLVFEKCANCHRSGEAAPFALMTYLDVRQRASQIVDVTSSRYMPPWPPGSLAGPFMDDRSLTDAQIVLFAQWYEQGMIEGDPAQLPAAPTWTVGWQLGEPDLVLTLDQPYIVPAEGEDVFRNFALEVPTTEPRMIKTVEFRPGNRQIMHHAVIEVDDTGWSRMEERRDPQPGFEIMFTGQSGSPEGFFIGWTPGRMPYRGDDHMGWLLKPGADIVINAHLLPTGKPELLNFMVGIHFQDKPVTNQPMMIRVGREFIDIQPGVSEYLVSADYTLPVDVNVLSICPHAHYLGKQFAGYATLPDGSRRELIHIADWDFNWQDEYRYIEPVYLPRGSTISMHLVYDNSADNARNPHSPPKRILYGPRSYDEMADLHLKVLPVSPRDLSVLKQHYRQKEARLVFTDCELLYKAAPDNPKLKLDMAAKYIATGRRDQAVALIDQALAIDPKMTRGLAMLAGLARVENRYTDSVAYMLRAIRTAPTDPYMLTALGETYTQLGRYDDAIDAFQRSLAIFPDSPMAHTYMAKALIGRGSLQESLTHYQQAAQLVTGDPALCIEYAEALLKAGKPKQAIEQCRQAIQLAPRWPVPRKLLAKIVGADAGK